MIFLFRLFILVYFILFFLLLMVFRSIIVWKKTGKNPFVIPSDDSAYGLIGMYFKALMLVLAGFVFVNYFCVECYDYFLPVNWTDDKYLRDEGAVVMIFSFIFIFVAQKQMQDSWRIGIDEKDKTKLINKGIFRYSRNPIYLGMISALAGLFLVAPTGLTLLIFALAYVLMQVQVRLEEEYLTRMHGQDYLDYKAKVGRWITFF